MKEQAWRGEKELHQPTARPGQVERRSLARPTLSFLKMAQNKQGISEFCTVVVLQCCY